MELWYVNSRMIEGYAYISVMLLAIDYDNDTFRVVPFQDTEFEQNEFWTSRDHIELPTKRMKLVKSK